MTWLASRSRSGSVTRLAPRPVVRGGPRDGVPPRAPGRPDGLRPGRPRVLGYASSAVTPRPGPRSRFGACFFGSARRDRCVTPAADPPETRTAVSARSSAQTRAARRDRPSSDRRLAAGLEAEGAPGPQRVAWIHDQAARTERCGRWADDLDQLVGGGPWRHGGYRGPSSPPARRSRGVGTRASGLSPQGSA